MDLLESLHQRLLLSIASSGLSADVPITIGDIYQRLIPYRAVRGELRILELAEYEHALLRLLAGERGYTEVEPDAVRLEIQRELASPNPLLGIYMDYPEARLALQRSVETGNPAGERTPATVMTAGPVGGRIDAAAGTAEGVLKQDSVATSAIRPASPRALAEDARTLFEDRPDPVLTPVEGSSLAAAREAMVPPTGPTAPTIDPLPLIHPTDESSSKRVHESARQKAAPGRSSREVSPLPTSPRPSSGHPPVPGPEPAHCRACSALLPTSIDARFCPFCGYRQAPCVCGRCGSRCEPGWSFCAGCGSDLR